VALIPANGVPMLLCRQMNWEYYKCLEAANN
jgi:hypothetical protein